MIKTLILSGGGIGGLIAIGSIKFFNKINYLKNIKTIWGTSVGCFIGICICLGYTIEELENIIILFDFSLLYNINDDNIINILDNYGIDNGDNLKIVVSNLIKNKGVKDNITFKELYDMSKIELNINTTCLDDLTTVIFNYKTHPDLSVLEICLNSMRIPLFYFANKYEHKYHCDGFLLNNCCIDMVDNLDESIAIISSNYKIKKTINSFSKYIEQILKCFYLKQDLIIYEKYNKYILKVDIDLISIDFNITDDTKKELIDKGYCEMEKYYENNKNRFTRKYKRKKE